MPSELDLYVKAIRGDTRKGDVSYKGHLKEIHNRTQKIANRLVALLTEAELRNDEVQIKALKAILLRNLEKRRMIAKEMGKVGVPVSDPVLRAAKGA